MLTDPDSQITGATVQITGNLASAEDVLALPSPPAGITAIYTPATGLLTLSGTASVADYQAALQAVTYRNTSSNPSTATRTVTFLASDASSTSAPATRDISITATNNAPDVDNSAGALAYTENDPATAIDTTITITDVDSANLTGALVTITGNFAGARGRTRATRAAEHHGRLHRGDRHADAVSGRRRSPSTRRRWRP